MVNFLTHTNKMYNSLNNEYIDMQKNSILITATPTAFVSFIIFRLSCEFENCLKSIVLDKLKAETKSSDLLKFIEQKTLLRPTKISTLKDNLNDHSLNINIDSLFVGGTSSKEKIFCDKIFGTKKDEVGNINLRNQLAHSIEFDYTNLPQWIEIPDYITACDNVLQRIKDNIEFKK